MLEHWTEHELKINGAAFFYRRSPSAGRPTLVLVHGFSDNGLCWLRAARALEQDYDILLPDVRGHGRSERVQPGQALDNAADLDALLGALGLENVLVGGHSMGAAAAAELGARCPGRVRGLLLEDPPWRETPPDAAPPRSPFWEWLTGLQGKTVEQIITYGRANNSPLWEEDEWLPWAESKRELDLNIFQALRAAPPWREVVTALPAPTLLITAEVEKGAIVTPEVAGEAAALNPHLRVAHIPGAGHSVRRENFAAYMDAVREFLRTF